MQLLKNVLYIYTYIYNNTFFIEIILGMRINKTFFHANKYLY